MVCLRPPIEISPIASVRRTQTRACGLWGIDTHEVLAGLTGNVYPIDVPESMVQFIPAGFVPALYGTTARRDFAIPRRDPFHIGSDGQEIVPSVVICFGAIVWDAAWRVDGRSDLARVDRVVEDRGTYVYWAYAVCVHASGWTDLGERREFGV